MDTPIPSCDFDALLARRDAIVRNAYFDVRCYLNGNGHLTFRHATDVDQLNRVLALVDGDKLGHSK